MVGNNAVFIGTCLRLKDLMIENNAVFIGTCLRFKYLMVENNAVFYRDLVETQRFNC